MTNNNRRKMKRKRIQQPEVFWNLNHKPRRTKASQKIVLVQPISKIKIRNTRIRRKPNLNLASGSKNKISWNPNIQNPRKKPVKGIGFIPKGLPSVPRNSFMFNNSNHFNKIKRSSYNNNLGFLNGSVPKKIKIEPMRMFTPVKMEPASFFQKENLYQRELNPWGDVDMDGSLNHMDCNPREISQDGILGDIAGKISGAVKGLFRKGSEENGGGDNGGEDVQVSQKTYGKLQEGISDVIDLDLEEEKKKQEEQEGEKQMKSEKYKEENIQKWKDLKKSFVKDVAEDTTLGDISGRVSKLIYPLRSAEGKEAVDKRQEIIKARQAEVSSKKLQMDRDKVAEIHTRDLKNLNKIERRLEKAREEGKPTEALKKQYKTLSAQERESDEYLSKVKVKLKEQTRIHKTLPALKKKESKLKSHLEIKRSRMVGGILSALTPLGAVPEIRRAATKKVSSKDTSEKGKRGRPRGPSGKYIVDGEAVTESNFQQIRAFENKKRKAMGMTKIPTRSLQLNTVKQAVSQIESPQTAVKRLDQVPPQEFKTEEGEAVPEELYEEGEAVPEELYEEPQQPQPQQPQRPLTVQEAQEQEQRDDNILHAPNIMKGELQQTAGIFHEDPRYNILNAPNFQKGGLRNVGETEEKAIIQVGERPNPNPYGEEYTDIDPGSGRTIVKRRPQEKWVTGEAL